MVRENYTPHYASDNMHYVTLCVHSFVVRWLIYIYIYAGHTAHDYSSKDSEASEEEEDEEEEEEVR
jgi:hypothetical protein